MSACIFGHANMPFEPILSRHRDVMSKREPKAPLPGGVAMSTIR